MTINGVLTSADGPIETFPLRGIEDSPTHLHDDRLLPDLVAFLKTL